MLRAMLHQPQRKRNEGATLSKDPARSTPERGRWRCPRHAPIYPRLRPRDDRAISARAENDPAACPYRQATVHVRNPRTSREDPPAAACAEHPSSLAPAVARRPDGFPVGSMHSYLTIALDKYPVRWEPR